MTGMGIVKDDKVLMQLRPRHWPRAGDKICFPGGRPKRGESSFAAARREAREEAGLYIPGEKVRRFGSLWTADWADCTVLRRATHVKHEVQWPRFLIGKIPGAERGPHRHCWLTKKQIQQHRGCFAWNHGRLAISLLNRRGRSAQIASATAAPDAVTDAYLGQTVFLIGCFGGQLKDAQGNLVLSREKQACETWRVKDAGGGKVFLESALGHYLKDHRGSPKLSGRAEAWEKWRILDADGKVFLRSHRGQNLSDCMGERVGMNGNSKSGRSGSSRWRRLSGTSSPQWPHGSTDLQ
jgi:8-oxo-dGTP pyrophosphatase MutT (NUDIX family)